MRRCWLDEAGEGPPLSAGRTPVAARRAAPLALLPHPHPGTRSRRADPNSGGSSFSILLGPAPHLDMTYTVFGEVTQGLDTLAKLEEVGARLDASGGSSRARGGASSRPRMSAPPSPASPNTSGCSCPPARRGSS